MAITKTVTGLVVADDFNRANGAPGGDWGHLSGGSLAISSNRLALSHTTTAWAENDAASMGEMFVQALHRHSSANGNNGILGRFGWSSTSNFNGYLLQLIYQTNQVQILGAVAGSFSVAAGPESITLNANTDYPAQLYVADSVQEAWVDGVALDATNTDHNGQGTRHVGIRHGGSGTTGLDDFLWCKTKFVTVTGLSAGQKAKIVGPSGIVAEATESDGTAVIDASRFGGATGICPLAGWARLIITDATGIVDTFSGAVYPGDEFEWNGVATNLDIWLRASDLDSLDPDDPVDSWPNAGGAGGALTAAGAARPLYKPTSNFSLNEQPALAADGSKAMSSAALGRYGGSPGLTVIALVDPGAGAGGRAIIARDGTDDRGWGLTVGADGRVVFAVANGPTTRCRRDGDRIDCRRFPSIIRARFDGDAGEMRIWVNGIEDTGALDGTIPAALGNDGPDLQVFNNGFGSSNFTGLGAVFRAIPRALSDEECESIEEGLIEDHALVVLEEIGDSGNVESHQGCATDGAFEYVSHTDRLEKREFHPDWSLVTQNADPHDGLSQSQHLGDIAYHDGKLYGPGSNFPSSGPHRTLIFSASDLSRIDAHDHSPETFSPSSYAVDTVRGVLWASRWEADSGVLQAYDLSTLARLSDLTLSEPISYLNGIGFNPHDGMLWSSSGGGIGGPTADSQLLTRIDPDTGVVRRTLRLQTAVGVGQGVDATQEGVLRWLLDPAAGGGAGVVRLFSISGAGVAPPTPATIAATATGPGEITVTRPTAAVNADSVELWASQTEADLDEDGPVGDAVMLSDDPGWPPEVRTGLGFSATWHHAEYATNDQGTVRSNVASATTDPDPASQGPPVRVDEITTTGARYRVEEADRHPDATHIRYRTRTTGGTLVDNALVPVSGDTPYTVAGLDPETVYSVTAAQVVDAVESAEGDATIWQTLAEVVPPQSESRFTSPPYATVVPGDDYEAEYTWELAPGRSVVSAEISTDLRSTWDAVAGATSTGISIDVSTIADGTLLLLRITLDDDTVLEHPGVVVANNITPYERRDFDEEDEFTRYLRPTETRYLFSGCLVGHTGHSGAPATQAPIASFGPITPIELTFHRRAFIAAEVAGWGILGGLFGTGSRSGEYQTLAVGLVGTGETTGTHLGIRAGLDWTTLGHNTGHGFATFRVAVGDMRSRPNQSNWHEFTMQVPVAASLWFPSCVYHPIRLWLDVQRPDPGTNPNRYDIAAYCEVPYPHGTTPDRRFRAVIEQQVDITDPISSEPHTLECGRLEVFTQKAAGQYGEYSRRSVVAITAWADADACDDPPEPEPEDEPEVEIPTPEPGRPCALLYQHFEADRETIAWEATTELGYLGATGGAVGHLLDPVQFGAHYGEQECDFAEGRASLIRAQVLINDPHQIPGDQDSGLLTERLSAEGRTAIHGHRGRYLRFIDFERGWVVIADGPCGTPEMDSEYAAYTWQIRDTRETERKTRAFIESGTSTLLPSGVLGGFGYNAETDTFLVDPTEPLEGVAFHQDGLYTLDGIGITISLTASPTEPRTIVPAAHDAMGGSVELIGPPREFADETNSWYEQDYRVTFDGRLIILWREQGSEDPYTEIRNPFIEGTVSTDPSAPSMLRSNLALAFPWPVTGEATHRRATEVFIGDADNPDNADTIPVATQEIEFIIVYRGPPTPQIPLHIEGITAGELVKQLYDGVYSARDENDEIRPTGIRYHEPDILALTTPVRLRITEFAKDVRDWVERHIYRPLGYAPALDFDGRISPMSQVAPDDMTGAVDINDLITEPAPSWNAGERIINIVDFNYSRVYVDTASEAVDGLSEREVQSIWKLSGSIDRHGEQVIEIDGLAFLALGDEVGGQVEVPELAASLAEVRGIVILDRWGEGAQSFVVRVMRDPTALLRSGSWVTCDLSCFPDYTTRRRGMISMGQIPAIKDENCAWREIVFEEAFSVELPGPPDFGS